MKTLHVLLSWYDTHGRRLPWRKTRAPYRIVVSELMLQQTQVERVKGYYRAWMKQFPSWRALAEATNAQVLDAWAGLGYNRRALALRDMARTIAEQGEPTTREGWLALKGIGPYTASAVMAFAFKEPVVPIDTNIRRVGGRWLLGTPFPQLAQDQEIEQALVKRVRKEERAYDIPQALFDIAVAYCGKEPVCGACPLRRTCRARKAFESGAVTTPRRMTPVSRERRHTDKPHPDRIYRGRVLAHVRAAKKPVRIQSLGPAIDPTYRKAQDAAWVQSLVERLEKDGMLTKKGACVTPSEQL